MRSLKFGIEPGCVELTQLKAKRATKRVRVADEGDDEDEKKDGLR